MGKSFFFLLLLITFAVGSNLNLTAKDDLVELQKKERKRRKKIKKSVIKITDENIHELAKKSIRKISRISTDGSNTLSGQPLSARKNNYEGEGNIKKNKEYWGKERLRIENNIKFYEKKVKLLTNRLNKLSDDYLIMDLPTSKEQIRIDMEKTRIELSKSKQQIPYFKKKLEELHDKARKEGVPPGWLR